VPWVCSIRTPARTLPRTEGASEGTTEGRELGTRQITLYKVKDLFGKAAQAGVHHANPVPGMGATHGIAARGTAFERGLHIRRAAARGDPAEHSHPPAGTRHRPGRCC